MITTPEQMREAAARLSDIAAKTLAKNAPMISRDTGVNQMFADLAATIRAIPIDQQPVAVTVNPLKGIDQQVMAAAALLNEKGKENPEWAFIDYESNAMSFGRWAKCGPNPAPYIRADIVMSAMIPHPADPLSDPRVKALVEAATKVADAYYDAAWEGDELPMQQLDASLRAIGGEV